MDQPTVLRNLNNFKSRSWLCFNDVGTVLRFSVQINVITLHTTYSSCKMLQNNTFFMLLSSRYTFIISPHHPHSDNCTLPFLHIDAFCQDLVRWQLSFHFYFKSYKVLYLYHIKTFQKCQKCPKIVMGSECNRRHK